MPRLRPRLLGAAVVVTAAALPSPASADHCLAAIDYASRALGVAPSVLHAVALTESARAGRPSPWAINDHGQARHFATEAEALEHVRQRLAEGATNIDIGCFQINWHWHGARLRDPARALNPTLNAVYAAGYLLELHRELGSWSAAIGAYHSRTEARARNYRCRVARQLAGPVPLADC